MPTIYNKRGLSDALNTVNPVLGSGEIVYVMDTNTLVVGNGSGVFSSLSVINAIPLTHSHVVSGELPADVVYLDANQTLTNKTLNAPDIIDGVFSDTFTIGSQVFYEQSTNGFSVNEDFDPSNSSTQTAYHFTTGPGRETLAFTLARTSQFTDGFGIYGTSSDNTFVTFGEQSNTKFEWRRGVGIRPLDLDGGTLLMRLDTGGHLNVSGSGIFGSGVDINGAADFSSTIDAPNLGAGEDNSVVILDSDGKLRTDEIDSRVWGSSLVDGAGTSNYVSKWSDSNTLTNSVIYDDGGNEVLITGIVNFELDSQSIYIGKSGLNVDISSQVDVNISSLGIYTSGSLTHNGSSTHNGALTHNGSLTQHSGNIVFNNSYGNYDFKIRGLTEDYLFFTNADANAVQIGTSSPAGKLAIANSSTNTSYSYALHSTSNYFSTSSSTYYAFGLYNVINKYVNAGVSDAGYGMACDLVAALNGNGTLAGTYGLRTYAGIGSSSSAGTNTTAYGISSRVINNGTGTSLIGEARGVDIYINGDLANNKTGVGITTAKALNIQTILDATNKWGIYQEGANDANYFAGNVHIGISSGSSAHKLIVNGGSSVFNESGGDYDFRVESTSNQSMFYIDSDANAIGIGTSSPSGILHLFQSSSPSLRIHASTVAGTSAARVSRGNIVFPNYNQAYEHVKLTSWGREGSFLAGMLGVNISNSAGVSSEVLTIDNQSTASTFGLRTYNIPIVTTSGNVIFNETGDNYDFRVEGDSDENLLFVDASNDTVNIGTSTSAGPKLYISTALSDSYATLLSNGGASNKKSLVRISNTDNTTNDSFAGLFMSSTRASTTVAQSACIATVSTNQTTYTPSLVFVLRSNTPPAFEEKMRINYDGNVGINTDSPTEKLDINSDAIRIRTAQTPASATANGNAGDICWDSNYIYVCVATNTWKRSAISTWP